MGDLVRSIHYDRFKAEFADEIAVVEEQLSSHWGHPAKLMTFDDGNVRVHLRVESKDEYAWAALPDVVFTVNPDDIEEEERVEEIACLFNDSPEGARERLRKAQLID